MEDSAKVAFARITTAHFVDPVLVCVTNIMPISTRDFCLGRRWSGAMRSMIWVWPGIEEPIVYDNLEGYARLAADLKTPVQIGENFYGPRALYTALQMKACDYVMPDFCGLAA